MHFLRPFILPVLTGLLVGLGFLLWQAEHSDPESAANNWLHRPGDSYADAVNKAAPAVVNIFTTQIVSRSQRTGNPFFDRYMEPPRRERILSSLGSGVIVSHDGYLLTSHHVVQDADEIIVALRDGREAPARVVGLDPETDLALLQITLEELPSLNLNGEDQMHVGDVVLAIGNPLGVGQTVSLGIVSATGRSNLGIATFENFIQTDAAINRGNSGGALVDTQGNLLGINTAILTSDGTWQGIGFATPASTARKVMEDLIEHGRVIRGWLGVTVHDINAELAQSLELDQVSGGLVAEVIRHSPAHLGGLQPGDVLTGIDGDAVQNGYQAMNIIAGMRPGTLTTLNVIRNRQAMDIQVVIGTRPSPG